MSWDTNYYHYFVPSEIACIAVTCIFAFITTGHIALFRRENSKFGILLVGGGLLEIAAYIARAVTHYQANNLVAYIVQLLLILLGPNLFAAAVLMFVGPLTEKPAPLADAATQEHWLTGNMILAIANGVAFLVQVFGATRLVRPILGDNSTYGEHIVVAGLAMQALLLVLALGLTVRGRATASELETGVMQRFPAFLNMRSLLWSTVLAICLLAIRNLARITTIAQGPLGYLSQRDWPTYAFDASLMIAIMVLTYPWHMTDFCARSETSLEWQKRRRINLISGHQLDHWRPEGDQAGNHRVV